MRHFVVIASICRHSLANSHVSKNLSRDYGMTSPPLSAGQPVSGTVCVADRNRQQLAALADILRETGQYYVQEASTPTLAERFLREDTPDVIVIAIHMPSGRELLRTAVTMTPPVPVVIVAEYSTVKQAVSAMDLGVVDFVMMPIDANDLKAAVARALERKQMLSPVSASFATETGFGELLGTSRSMQTVYDQIRRAAPFRSTVYISGESGTGKELVAGAIHALSAVSSGPFIPVNCAALPRDLVESMFFGHDRGSFTGATRTRQGFFESANNGTLFLDEVGDLSMQAQTKLLRVLEEQKVRRLGATRAIEVNVRVVAASNKNLPDAIRVGRFREDLFYRLNVIPIVVPPLRERKEDIPLLVRVFADRFSAENGVGHIEIPEHCLEPLIGYDWPGNVRELKNIAERIVIRASDSTAEITVEDVVEIMPKTSSPPGLSLERDLDFGQRTLDEHERVLILDTLEHTGGNRTHAAEILGISLRTMQRKLKQYGANET